MLRRVGFGVAFFIFCASAVLFAVGVLTHYDYRIGWGYSAILDGGVYIHRRGAGVVLNIPFFIMLGVVVCSGVASWFLWKQRNPQPQRGFQIDISN